MKRSLPTKLPKFKSDAEIAAFMEKYSGFDLLDAGLAEFVPTPSFARKPAREKALLKDKRVQIAFKDERPLRRIFPSSRPSSARIFFVIDADLSGILLGLLDSQEPESLYVPFLNISGIKILGESERA
jgi:hypothetical protein